METDESRLKGSGSQRAAAGSRRSKSLRAMGGGPETWPHRERWQRSVCAVQEGPRQALEQGGDGPVPLCLSWCTRGSMPGAGRREAARVDHPRLSPARDRDGRNHTHPPVERKLRRLALTVRRALPTASGEFSVGLLGSASVPQGWSFCGHRIPASWTGGGQCWARETRPHLRDTRR